MGSKSLHTLLLFFIGIIIIHVGLTTSGRDADTHTWDPLTISQLIISKYSSNKHLSSSDFLKLYHSLEVQHISKGLSLEEEPSTWCEELMENSTCSKQCNGSAIFNMYAVGSSLNSTSLLQALPIMYISQDANRCRKREFDLGELHSSTSRQATKAEVWGYGIGFVVLVCLVSNLGGLLAPLSKSKFFQRLLMFLVSTAVGTLVATGLLVLIPEALDLMAMGEAAEGYIEKMSTVLAGIVFFYLSERLLKTGFSNKKSRKEKKMLQFNQELVILKSDAVDIADDAAADEEGTKSDVNNTQTAVAIVEKKDEEEEKGEVRTVAWMMLFGDGLHKFVDGLSVGAAYSKSIRTGLTLSIAILCEELPHELGDIAILLHSGMTMKRALLYNTLSAAVGLLGLTAGIFLGEVHSATLWIFAVTAGIFLYVPLVDMLPEMSQAADDAVKEGGSSTAVTLTQVLGLCLGYAIILVVTLYAGEISL